MLHELPGAPARVILPALPPALLTCVSARLRPHAVIPAAALLLSRGRGLPGAVRSISARLGADLPHVLLALSSSAGAAEEELGSSEQCGRQPLLGQPGLAPSAPYEEPSRSCAWQGSYSV